MKKTISVFMIAAFVATCLSSCNEKKKSQVIIAPKPSAPKPKKTQELSSYEPTSPPIITDKTIVMAGSVTDNFSTRKALQKGLLA